MLFAAGVLMSGITPSAAQEEKDTSGTNPALLTRTLSISSEYRFLPGDDYYNQTLVRFTEPLFEGKAAMRLTIPLDATNRFGGDDFGVGDISAKFSWIPYTDLRQAFILSAETYAPTASDDLLGTGKWVAAPGITWAYFASPEVIIAPAYIHNLSFAGEDDRLDVNRGDFDLYVVYRPHGERWWITSDLTVSHDFESESTPVSWEMNFGRNLKVFESGAALNGYVRPGIGFGSDRPYDFNIEVGLTLLNF